MPFADAARATMAAVLTPVPARIVVRPHMNGVGGDAFLLIRDGGGRGRVHRHGRC
jgi:gamma-glutamyltranspeptidase